MNVRIPLTVRAAGAWRGRDDATGDHDGVARPRVTAETHGQTCNAAGGVMGALDVACHLGTLNRDGCDDRYCALESGT